MRKKHRVKQLKVKPIQSIITPLAPYMKKWQLSNQVIDDIAFFDIRNKDILSKIWRTSKDIHFCLSPMIIPPSFRLIREEFKPGIKVSIQDFIYAAENNNVWNLSTKNQHIYLVHEIDENDNIEHPCTEHGITGSKACAYNVYTASSEDETFEPLILVFYVNNASQEVQDKLKEWYDKLIKLPPLPSGEPRSLLPYPEPTNWEKLYVVPLMLPDTSIIYFVVPHSTKDNKSIDYLTDIFKEMKKRSWAGINYSFEFLDEWESIVTLDLKIKCIPT